MTLLVTLPTSASVTTSHSYPNVKHRNESTISRSKAILLHLLQQFSQSKRDITFAQEVLVDNPDCLLFGGTLPSGSQSSVYLCLTDNSILLVNTDKNASSRTPFSSDLRHLKQIAISENDPNLLSLTVTKDYRTEQIRLLTRQRNYVVEDIQIATKAYHLEKIGQIGSVDVVIRAFTQTNGESVPVVPTTKTPGTRRFYRAGYWFDVPSQFVDKNESVLNRPFSTYFLINGEGEADPDNARMLVRIEPARQLLMTNEYHCHSDQSLRLWTEMSAHTIARNELIGEDGDSCQYLFFECSKLEAKESNEHEGQWIAYKVMVALPSRHIVLIGVRRNFLPPLADQHQDLLFVYIDESQPLTSPDRMHIDESCGDMLVEVVKSLRPASEEDILSPEKIPFYDIELFQARSDAFLDDVIASAWLRATFSVKPERTVLSTRWKHLLFAFCGTLLRLTPDFANPIASVKSGSNDEREQKWQKIRNLAFADDPLSLTSCVEQELIEQLGSITDEAAVALLRSRIAAQFMMAVNGSENIRLPIPMSIEAIVGLACESKDISTRAVLNRVLDYLAHIRTPGRIFQQNGSILDKIKDETLMSNFICNEHCLVEILSPSYHYLQSLIRENNWASDLANSSLASFYKALLMKNYNLDLFRIVCIQLNRIEIAKSSWRYWLSLIDPLTTLLEQGNLYVKRWSSDALHGVMSCQDLLKEVSTNGKVLQMALDNLLSSNDSLLMQASARLVSVLLPLSERFEEILIKAASPIIKLLTPVVRGQKRNQDLCREVAVLVSTLSTIEKGRGVLARSLFQKSDAITVLMAFLEEHQFYVDIIEPIGKAIGSLFYQCEKTLKRQAILHLETLKTVVIQSTSRLHRSIILQIINNISFRSFPVIHSLRKMGFDKLLKTYLDIATTTTQESTNDPLESFQRIQEVNVLTTLYNRIAKLPVIQICFLIECTAAMSSYVKLLPATLQESVATMLLGIEGCACEADIKVSFVGYKVSPKKYFSSGFEDPNVIRDKLSLLRPKGGRRAASNLIGAMLYALEEHELNGDLRFMVILASNPPYGKRFHDPSIDDLHPNKKYGKDKLTADEVLEDIRVSNIEILMECMTDSLQLTATEFRTSQLNISVFPDLGFDTAEERMRHFSQTLAQKISGVFVQQFN